MPPVTKILNGIIISQKRKDVKWYSEIGNPEYRLRERYGWTDCATSRLIWMPCRLGRKRHSNFLLDIHPLLCYNINTSEGTSFEKCPIPIDPITERKHEHENAEHPISAKAKALYLASRIGHILYPTVRTVRDRHAFGNRLERNQGKSIRLFYVRNGGHLIFRVSYKAKIAKPSKNRESECVYRIGLPSLFAPKLPFVYVVASIYTTQNAIARPMGSVERIRFMEASTRTAEYAALPLIPVCLEKSLTVNGLGKSLGRNAAKSFASQ